jgi:hypothetical protein
MHASSVSRFLFAVLLALSACALAVPPDQPPLAIGVVTPNFNYSVRSGGGAPHFVPESRLTQFARALDRNGTPQPGNPLGYHPGYVGQGFSTPFFSGGSNDVVFWACADNGDGFDCDNGFATLDQIIMPTDVYGNASESCVRGILGHELFHHVEYRYALDGGRPNVGCGEVFGATACEGQARALQDKIYFDLDLNPAASCVATFRGQVDGYLGAPDVTIWNASYGSALFWTYLMEQYGEVSSEPARGIDFLVDWWDVAQADAQAPGIYQITEDAIQFDHPQHTVLGAYHDFIIANAVKDLDLAGTDTAFRNRYSYRDEEPVAGQTNLMQFAAVAMPADLVVPNGGSASSNVSAQRFGAEYRRFDVRACAAGRTLEFSALPAPQSIGIGGGTQQGVDFDAMFALVPLRGGAAGRPGYLYKQRAKSWKQTILQPATPYTHVLAVTSGWHTRYEGSLALRCKPAPPPAAIGLVSSAHPASAGAPGSGAIGELTIAVEDPESPFAPLDTLAAPDFEVQVGLLLPAVQKVREAGGRHRLVFPWPTLPLGDADLEVRVGTQTHSVPGGVRVAPHRPEIVIALDASASMAMPVGSSKLDGAKRHLRALLAALPDDSRVALLSFAGSSAAPGSNVVLRVPLAPLDAAQRSTLLGQLAAITPEPALTIKLSDVLVSSITQFDTQGDGGERHLLLLTDSGDGAADAASLVQAARDAGVRVHASALDTRSDQPLLARLSAATGGSFGLFDLPTRTAAIALPNLLASRRIAMHATPVASGSGEASAASPAVIELRIDAQVDAPGGGGPHVKVFSGQSAGALASVRLFRPDGSEAVAGADVTLVHSGDAFAFRVANGASGTWRIEAHGASGAGAAVAVLAHAEVIDAASSLRLAFAPPAGTPGGSEAFRGGDAVLIQAALVDVAAAPPPPAQAHALVKHGAGTWSIALRDDGQGGDEQADDRVWSGIFRGTLGASPSGFDEDGSGMRDDGSYAVEVSVDTGTRTAPLVLREERQFVVLQESTLPDADGDGLPDRFEVQHACLDATAADAAFDSDGDGAGNALERAEGSDPCDVDSDDGGETDGSELARGALALDASDDGVRRIRDLAIITEASDHEEQPAPPPLAHTLRYDADAGYAALVVKRAADRAGPFVDHAVLDAAAIDGRYIDGDVVAGQSACYQLVGRSAAGAIAAASDTVCGIARVDNRAPRGSIVLDDGAARSTSGLLGARLAIDGEPAVGMQMNLRAPDGSESGWIAYTPFVLLDAGATPPPAVLTAAVRFRDASGNESALYVDEIDRVAANSVGRIIGRVRADDGAGGGGVIVGARLALDVDTEAGAESSGAGSFLLDALPPGTYALQVEHPGYAPLTVTGVVVAAGATVDLGDLLLGTAPLFADGFEDP